MGKGRQSKQPHWKSTYFTVKPLTDNSVHFSKLKPMVATRFANQMQKHGHSMGTSEGLDSNSNGRRPHSVERVTQLLRHAGSPVPRSADRTQFPLPPTPNQFISNLRGLSYQQSHYKQQGQTHRTDKKNSNLIWQSFYPRSVRKFVETLDKSKPLLWKLRKKTQLRYGNSFH